MKIRKSLLIGSALAFTIVGLTRLGHSNNKAQEPAAMPVSAPVANHDDEVTTAETVVNSAPGGSNTVAEAASVDPAKEQRDAMLIAMGFGTTGGHGFAIHETNQKTQ